MSDDASSLLTKGQRAYLRGESEPTDENHERVIRNRIKKRVIQGFRDVEILLAGMDLEDRASLFRTGINRYPSPQDADREEFKDSVVSLLAFTLRGYLDGIFVGSVRHGEDALEELLQEALDRGFQAGESEYGEIGGWRYEVTIERVATLTEEDAISMLSQGDVSGPVLNALLEHGWLDANDIIEADSRESLIEKAREE